MSKNSTNPVVELDPMQKVNAEVNRVAKFPTTVLLTGETGVGKGYIAKEIYEKSRRSEKGFLTLNCTGIPPTLIESMLFGHEKGAFSGADERRIGYFEEMSAKQGTLFIDEIGELPPELQVKFLQVLEESIVTRMGSNTPIDVNVRIIAATNRDLEEMVQEGSFREDLFYRLNIFRIHIPPLRLRRDEIPELINTFIKQLNKKFEAEFGGESFTPREIPQETLKYLQDQRFLWRGNIRQLRNAIETAMVRTETPEALKREDFQRLATQALPGTSFDRFMSKKNVTWKDIEKKYGRGKGPQKPEALNKTLSALLEGSLEVKGLDQMGRTDEGREERRKMGYVAVGAINYFVKFCSKLFFGKQYDGPPEFVSEARKVVKPIEDDMVQTASESEDANEPLS